MQQLLCSRCLFIALTSMKCTELCIFQFSSVAQLCPTFCDPMNRSTPGLPVHHQLPEFTQTHVHRVSDAIQPSHPLPSPSPPALSVSVRSIPSSKELWLVVLGQVPDVRDCFSFSETVLFECILSLISYMATYYIHCYFFTLLDSVNFSTSWYQDCWEKYQ